MEQAEWYMAVIHIDGNKMGVAFDEVCKKAKKYEDISNFSISVDELYKYAWEVVKRDIPKKSVRLIYRNGDDLTFVCHCAYALGTVEKFMQELQKRVIRTPTGEKKLSACAGIAYVKPTFPFYRAYGIAEARCHTAKQKALEENTRDENVGCWVDFEVVRGSENTGMIDSAHVRPYIISASEFTDAKDRFDLLKAELKRLREKEIPRSSWKDLRNAHLLGNLDRVALIMNSKGIDIKADERTPLYDACDIADLEVLL